MGDYNSSMDLLLGPSTFEFRGAAAQVAEVPEGSCLLAHKKDTSRWSLAIRSLSFSDIFSWFSGGL